MVEHFIANDKQEDGHEKDMSRKRESISYRMTVFKSSADVVTPIHLRVLCSNLNNVHNLSLVFLKGLKYQKDVKLKKYWR